MSTIEIVYVVLFVICVLMSAFFSVAEIAFVSLQRFKLEHLVERKVKGSEIVAALIQRPERLLSAILLGTNFFNTAAAALGTTLAVTFLDHSGVAIATVAVTIILLVFSDTLPKTTAAHHAETIAVALARTIQIISWIFSPVVIVLSWTASGFGRLVGARTVARSLVSAEEIRTMITVGHRDGAVDKEEAEMLHKVFDFGDRPAREIMVPRTEVVWIEKGVKVADFFALYKEKPLNRYPVFHHRRDNVAGILAVKDVLMAVAKGTHDPNSTIDDLIRPAFFAPETKSIGGLLTDMRDKNYHMCIIVDEYGGTAGIVTFTQIVEEIVGRVRDELAAVEKDFEVIDESTFQIDGGMRIEDANKKMGLDIPEGEYETVAGFVLDLLGHIPKQGEQLRYKNLKLVITRMRGHKIEEILLTKEKHAAPAH